MEKNYLRAFWFLLTYFRFFLRLFCFYENVRTYFHSKSYLTPVDANVNERECIFRTVEPSRNSIKSPPNHLKANSSFETLFTMKLFLLLIFTGLCYAQSPPDLEPKTIEQAALVVARYISALSELGLATDGDQLVRNMTSDSCYCPITPSDGDGKQYFTGVLPIQSMSHLNNFQESLLRHGGEVVGASHRITVRSGDGELHHVDTGMFPIDPAHIADMIAAGEQNIAQGNFAAPQNAQGQGMQHPGYGLPQPDDYAGQSSQPAYMNPQMASQSPMQSNGPQVRHDVHAPQTNPPPQSYTSPPPDRFNPYHQPMHGPIYSQATAQSRMDSHSRIQTNSVNGHQPFRRNTAPSDGMHPDSYTAMYGTPHSNLPPNMGVH